LTEYERLALENALAQQQRLGAAPATFFRTVAMAGISVEHVRPTPPEEALLEAVFLGTRPSTHPRAAETASQLAELRRMFDELVRVAREVRELRDEYHRIKESLGDRQAFEHELANLAEEWLRDTRAISSMEDMVLHPAYQRIIGKGRDALPFLLRRFESEPEPENWFWALRAITGVDPVSEEDAGNIDRMAEAWLLWGRQQKLL
jgi:hypothetical protein